MQEEHNSQNLLEEPLDRELAMNVPAELADEFLAILRRFEDGADSQESKKDELPYQGHSRRVTRGRRVQEAKQRDRSKEMPHREAFLKELRKFFGKHELCAE